MSIQAIETEYNGYLFRSRLEARWAVFFETLGIPWEYEVEGFQLPNGEWYLPDFRLHHYQWVEIKPRPLLGEHLTKPALLHVALARPLLYANPPAGSGPLSILVSGTPYVGEYEIHRVTGFVGDWVTTSGGYAFGPKGSVVQGDWDRIDPERTLLAAYRAARQARFEHGQVGAPKNWISSRRSVA